MRNQKASNIQLETEFFNLVKFFLKNDEDNESMTTDFTLGDDHDNLNSATSMEDPTISSQLVSNFENFKIIMNGWNVNSELSDKIRLKYFNLCSTRRSVLHCRLLMGINGKLAAEIISKTTNISESIKESKLNNCEIDLETWDKTLEGFKMLGMDVGFICARINRLLGLTIEARKVVDTNKYREVKFEYRLVEDEIRSPRVEAHGS